MSPSATPGGDAARARAADVGAEGDPPAHAGGARGDRGGGDSPEDASFPGGEQSPPPRYFAAESFDGDDAEGVAGNDAPASPVADRREDDDSDDGRVNGVSRGSHASRGSPVARVRTPDLKLRRPKPKQSAYHVVIKPRTPSPEPPTPPPSHPATPAASESESESEDERCPPSPEPPPPRAADARLAGKKLRLTVLGVRNAPVGFGDVFCVVECGSAVLETTVPAPPPNAAPVQSAASAFEIFFDAPGASGDVAVAATGERGKPRASCAESETADDADDAPVSHARHLPIELARVTLSAYDLLPDGDLDEAFVARLATVDVGDWVPMRRPARLHRLARKIPGASVPVATTSVRVVARLVDADHVESWDAERALADAVARMHECAETGDDADAQSAFDALEAAFAVKTLPREAARAARGWRTPGDQDKKETHHSESPAASARACLDVARSTLDTRSTSTALARACARPTPAGEACALRLLALGAKPSVSFFVYPTAISSSAGDGEDEGEDAVENAARRHHASTAAHVAARANNWRVLARMLDIDAAGVLGARDGEGYPALHVAITARAVEATRVLARGGADPEVEVCVNAGRGRAVRVNAFELAARSGDDRIVDAVFDIVRHRSTLSRETINDEEKKAIINGEEKNTAEFERSLTSALFAAARVGDARAARRAAEALGDVSAKHPLLLERHDRAGGKTVLETAAGRGAAGVIRALLADQRSSGAGLAPREPGDGVNSAGAMAWAAYARSDEAVEAVLAAGVTAGDEWAAASRVAETRGASMRVRRVLRGRAGRGTA